MARTKNEEKLAKNLFHRRKKKNRKNNNKKKTASNDVNVLSIRPSLVFSFNDFKSVLAKKFTKYVQTENMVSSLSVFHDTRTQICFISYLCLQNYSSLTLFQQDILYCYRFPLLDNNNNVIFITTFYFTFRFFLSFFLFSIFIS